MHEQLPDLVLSAMVEQIVGRRWTVVGGDHGLQAGGYVATLRQGVKARCQACEEALAQSAAQSDQAWFVSPIGTYTGEPRVSDLVTQVQGLLEIIVAQVIPGGLWRVAQDAGRTLDGIEHEGRKRTSRRWQACAAERR